MKEKPNIELIVKEVLRNEEVLEIIETLNLFNTFNTKKNEDGEYSLITTKDYRLYNIAVKEWKNTTDKAYKEIYDLNHQYTLKTDLDTLESHILFLNVLGKAENTKFIKTIAEAFFIIKKYKGTSLSEELLAFFKDLIHVLDKKDIKITDKNNIEQYKKANDLLSKKVFYYFLSDALNSNKPSGKYEIQNFGQKIELLSENKYIENKLENYLFKDIIEFSDYVASIIKTLKESALDYDQAFKQIGLIIATEQEKNGIKELFTEEEKEIINQKLKDAYNLLKSDAYKETTLFNLAQISELLAFDEETKELLKADAEKQVKKRIPTKKSSKPHTTEEVESQYIENITKELKRIQTNENANPLKSGWVKVKTDSTILQIHENRQRLGNYADKKANYQNKVKELEAKKKPSKQDIEDIKYYKAQIETLEEDEAEKKKDLIAINENLKDLGEKLLKAEDLEDKHNTEALIRFNTDRKNAIEKELNKGTNYLAQTLDGLIEAETKNVKSTSPISTYDLTSNTEIGEYFLEYAENQLYYFPQSKYIMLDPKIFTEYIGRNANSYRAVKKELLKNLYNMFDNERHTIKHKVYYINGQKITLDNARISLVSDILPMKIGRRDIILVALGETFKELIITNSSKQWASIPYYLNQISKENPVASKIGKWLYKDIRRNLKGNGDYKRTLTLKFLVDTFTKLGILKPRDKRYSEDVIKTLKSALTCLSGINTLEIKFISYDTKAFDIYEDNLKGKKEEEIIRAFEEQSITIIFHTIDKEAYDPLRAERERHRKKTLKTKETKKENIKKISSKEYDKYLEENNIEK